MQPSARRDPDRDARARQRYDELLFYVALGALLAVPWFLADLVLPNGNVLHDEIAPRLARWREGGPAVPLIPERASP